VYVFRWDQFNDVPTLNDRELLPSLQTKILPDRLGDRELKFAGELCLHHFFTTFLSIVEL
jgi:hypothetical protein